MPYGLNEETIEMICKVLSRHPNVEKAVLFGSRAKGTYKAGSDIDLSLHGAAMTATELGEIDSEWDDLLLPYTIDLLIFDRLTHENLREHIERVGQFFERAFELGWKVLKDYLEGEGFSVASPRDAIKQAFQSGLLADDHVWIEALKDRNLTVHTYEEKIAAAVEQKIRKAYFPALMAMSRTLPAKAD